MIASQLDPVCTELAKLNFKISQHRFWLNARLPGSELVVQFTTDPRYQDFLGHAVPAEMLGVQVCVAALGDLFRGKLWAALDPERRITKRVKDELDLVRLAERYPEYVAQLPTALRARL